MRTRSSHLHHLALASLLSSGCGAIHTAPPPNGVGGQAAPSTTNGSLVVVRVVLNVQEEDVDAFLQRMTVETARVPAQHPGCLRYAIFRDPEVPTRFMLYEEWESEAAFSAFESSADLQESFAVLGPMLAAPPDSQYFLATLRP